MIPVDIQRAFAAAISVRPACGSSPSKRFADADLITFGRPPAMDFSPCGLRTVDREDFPFTVDVNQERAILIAQPVAAFRPA